MRRSSLFLLALGITAVPAALAQSSGAWSNTDPGCDDTIYNQTVQVANQEQAKAERDAEAVNDYLKKIKEGPRSAGDKLLSCVDLAWPDLPFGGVLPGIEEYISKVGDKAVDEACRKMRNEVRKVDSVFSKGDLRGSPLQGIATQAVNSAVSNAISSGTSGSAIPTQAAPASQDGNGAFGGLIDLIKPPSSGSGKKVQP